MKYIIKVSPEITIKSKPVRKRCILLLKNNIKKHFDFNKIDVRVFSTWDVVELKWKDEKIPKILSMIPWIANFMEVESFLLPEDEKEIFNDIFDKVKNYYLEKIEWKTFVVRVKRSWNHNFKSIDLEKYIWGWLLEFSKNAKVKLKNSEITVKIEVKDKKYYIVKNITNWLWGYPVSFQGKVLSLISGWFDSWVSTFSMMKRWCEVDFLFFNLWWNAHELGVKQVSYYLWKTFSVPNKKARFILVNFEEIIWEILTKINHKFRWIILKRLMLKVASIISENHYYALIKWDSLGQVSSQTLKNLHIIDKASSNLVLRPLIWFNKQEIIDISSKIWTYNFACNMPEYCWIISDKPSTWAKEEDILDEEKLLDENLLFKVIEERQTEFVSEMMEKYKEKENIDLEIVFLPWDWEIIIDIRAEEQEKKKNPINLENIQILDIPFFQINHKFIELDQTKIYLFYCEKWVLSRLHWLYLKEKWFNNIKILKLNKNPSICKK